MHRASALSCHRQILAFDNMDFGSRPTRAHFVNMDAVIRAVRRFIIAHLFHTQNFCERQIGITPICNGEGNRPKAANLMLRRNGAFFPRIGFTRTAVIDQSEPLTLRIFEQQREAAIMHGGLFVV